MHSSAYFPGELPILNNRLLPVSVTDLEETPNPIHLAMPLAKTHWAIAYLAVAVWMYLKPEQAAFNSAATTVAVSFALITLSWLLYLFVLYPAFLTPLKHLPVPPGRHWLKGNVPIPLAKDLHVNLMKWMETVPNDGLIRFYGAGNIERVAVANPKAFSEVLVHKAYDFEKPAAVRATLGRITGIGVLLAEGEEHKIQRKNLMPAFSFRHIKDLYPVFWDKSVEMVKLMEKELQRRQDAGEDNVIVMSHWASRATLDIIGVAGMDHDFQSLQNPGNELNRQYRRITQQPPRIADILFLIGMLTSTSHLMRELPTQRNKELNEASEYIRKVARQVIREKKEKLQGKEPSAAKTDVDIVSVALQSGTFTEENLVDQMMTFLGAGHETTASALQWAIYALSKHHGVQTRLREEIRASLPSISLQSPEPVSAATVDALPYLNAFCNEVLRFYPPVRFTVRVACRDTVIVGNHIPKGTVFSICPDLANLNKDLWGPDADRFNPDRWLGPGRANTGGANSSYAVLTFLHGPRNCIGQGFSKSELACLVAAVVGKFYMELEDPNKPLEVNNGVTMRPKDVRVKFTALEGW